MEYQYPKYTCPIHPDVIQDEPGNCPVCGMNLVPVNIEERKNGPHYSSNNRGPAKMYAGPNNIKRLAKTFTKPQK